MSGDADAVREALEHMTYNGPVARAAKAALARLEACAEALLRIQVEELNGRLCARPEMPDDPCCPDCRETWRLVDAALAEVATREETP